MATRNDHPSISANRFRCPHCDAYSNQIWCVPKPHFIDDSIKTPTHAIERINSEHEELNLELDINSNLSSETRIIYEHTDNRIQAIFPCFFSQCNSCEEYAIWVNDRIVYPQAIIRIPKDDMPDQIKTFYRQASSISSQCPPASAALLRTVLEMLCTELNYTEGSLKQRIEKMKNDGKIDDELHDAMQSVRIVGNNAVHAGQIEVDDSKEVVKVLFEIIDDITLDLFTKPKRRKELSKNVGSI